MSTPRIALCIGHSREINGRRDGGAVSVGGQNEWTYNRALADMIGAHLTRHRLGWIVIDYYQGKGYGGAMRWLATELQSREIGAAIELHFNSASATARGHEWLFWHNSNAGKRLAESLYYETRLQLPPNIIPARGIKPIANGRGDEFLRRMHCPAIIAEPFFGSNADDWKLATEKKEKIALAIANGLAEWVV